MMDMEIIKVSGRSRATAVAGAIAGVVREEGHAEVQAIGAGAVNQAVKAVAIARKYLALDGLDVICEPSFVEVMIENRERTAIRLVVEPRDRLVIDDIKAGRISIQRDRGETDTFEEESDEF